MLLCFPDILYKFTLLIPVLVELPKFIKIGSPSILSEGQFTPWSIRLVIEVVSEKLLGSEISVIVLYLVLVHTIIDGCGYDDGVEFHLTLDWEGSIEETPITLG